jgi:hypothetical protein
MKARDLSSAERNVVRDYIRLGSLVAVAEKRCRSIKTIEMQTRIAREKFGGISLVQLAILVDREDPIEIAPKKRTGGFE